MLELLVVLAVMGLLAGALAPQVMARLAQGQSATIQAQLANLGTGLLAFRQDVGRYPQTLRQLSTPPAAGARDACGRAFAGGTFPLWNGPYLSREIGTGGIPVGTSTIENTLTRVPASYSETGTIFVHVSNVEIEVALRVDRALDGDGNLGAGGIRWTPAGAGGVGTLSHAIPVRGC